MEPTTQQPEQIVAIVVRHEQGISIFAGRTEDSATAQLANYCRTYWDCRGNKAVETHAGLNDGDVVAAYFNEDQEEYYNLEMVNLLP